MLDIYDPVTSKVVYTRQISKQQDLNVNLEGNKYDNKLKYRFTIANDLTGESALTDYKLIAPGGIGNALKILDPSVGGEFDLEILDGVTAEEITYFMRNVLMNSYQKLLLRADRKMLSVYGRFIDEFNPILISQNSEVQYVHQIISVLVAYINRCNSRETPVAALDEDTVNRIIANYCRANDIDANQAEKYPGLLVAKGHLMNLSNRVVAAECYAKALEIGAVYLKTFLRVDALTTFFGKVPTGYTPEISDRNSTDNSKDKRINICFSVDPKYFKMYAPIWAATSAFYKDIVFNYLLVTESREEFEQLAAEYETIISSFDSLVRINKRGNVRLFWLENRKAYGRTLFACARFYLVNKVLKESEGDVFVCDIDQFVIGDLSKFLRETGKNDSDIQLALVENYFALLPGRSHLAGYIYLKNSDLAQAFANDVTDYIAAGLGVDFSWMLDQNAIRYASERTQVTHLDMRAVRVFGHYGAHKDALRARLV